MKKFLLGTAAGMTALAIAVPLAAQLSIAASPDQSSGTPPSRPVPSQACVQALAAKDDAYLATIDAMVAVQKTATQAHEDALKSAAALTDDAARQKAVQQADEDFRTAFDSARKSDAADTSAMDAVRSACGDAFGSRGGPGGPGGPMGGGHGEPGHAPDFTSLAKNLGMTTDELQAAMKSGKSLEDIAKEKGVELPTPPHAGSGSFMHDDGDGMGPPPPPSGLSDSSSSQSQ